MKYREYYLKERKKKNCQTRYRGEIKIIVANEITDFSAFLLVVTIVPTHPGNIIGSVRGFIA